MKNVLRQVDLVVSKYREVEKITGENFNIFSIMGMESDEVRTHSALIAELLDPNGSHGLGAEPLELLIEQLYPGGIGLDYETATCGKEVYAGKINEDYTEGGRIDLLIKDNEKTRLIIENKIYAPEQKNQLLRYRQRFPDAKLKLLFLTLNGKESDEKEIDYRTISYKGDILNWIESCAKLAWNRPMVREVLVHYAYLIKILTNQTINEKMSEEIVAIIQSNFEASAEIYKNFEKALVIKQSDFLRSLQDSLIKRLEEAGNEKWKVGDDKNDVNNLILRLKIVSDKHIISFHFKNLKNPLILIEKMLDSTDKPEVADKKIILEVADKKIMENLGMGYKKPDWPTSTCVLWQHKWNNLGAVENIIKADITKKHEEVAGFLIKTVGRIDELIKGSSNV